MGGGYGGGSAVAGRIAGSGGLLASRSVTSSDPLTSSAGMSSNLMSPSLPVVPSTATGLKSFHFMPLSALPSRFVILICIIAGFWFFNTKTQTLSTAFETTLSFSSGAATTSLMFNWLGFGRDRFLLGAWSQIE